LPTRRPAPFRPGWVAPAEVLGDAAIEKDLRVWFTLEIITAAITVAKAV